MNEVIEFHTINENGLRLSDYLVHKLENLPSRKSVKKAISNQRVLVNNKVAKTADLTVVGDVVSLLAEDYKHPTYKFKLEVVFENDEFAVILKPAGIKVSGNEHQTIQNALPYNLEVSNCSDKLIVPRPVHRLDVPTSGLLLIAKTYSFMQHAFQLFETNNIHKTYQTITYGLAPENGTITNDLEEKKAHTDYQLMRSCESVKNKHLSWLEVKPVTGRTHQIRKHLHEIGHPIVGDKTYFPGGKLQHKGLFLTAVKLEFPDSNGKPYQFEVQPPSKFKSLWEREAKMLQNAKWSEQLKKWILADEYRTHLLNCISQIEEVELYLSAGIIRNFVWDILFNTTTPVNDVDVIYYDSEGQSEDQESIEKRLKAIDPNTQWSVKNQALMHVRNGHQAYTDIRNAMEFWPETATGIAIRKEGEQLQIISANGLSDLMNGIIRKSPKADETIFKDRFIQKNWPSIWSNLIVS